MSFINCQQIRHAQFHEKILLALCVMRRLMKLDMKFMLFKSIKRGIENCVGLKKIRFGWRCYKRHD